MTFEDTVEQYFRNNYNNMFKQAKGILKDHHYAEDAIQDAMYQALKYGGEGVEKLDGWMGMLVYNACRSLAKSIKNKGITMEVDPHLFPVDIFDTAPENLIDVEEAVKSLFPESVERKALILWVVKGYTPAELSKDFGVPQAKLYKMWRELKETLKKNDL